MKEYKSLIFILFLIFAFSILSSPAEELPNYFKTDFNKAKQNKDKDKDYILAVFSASWCAPCQLMIKNIYPQEKVKNGLKNYVCVYIDGDKNPSLVKQYKIQGFPSFLVMNKSGVEFGRFSGGAPDSDTFLKEVEKARKQKDIIEQRREKISALGNKIKIASSVKLYIERAKLNLEDEDYLGAIEDYKNAAKLDKDGLLQIKGDLLYWETVFSEDKIETIVLNFEKIVSDFPKCENYITSKLYLIDIYAQHLKNDKKAIELAETFIKDHPKHEEVGHLKHKLLHLKGTKHEEP